MNNEFFYVLKSAFFSKQVELEEIDWEKVYEESTHHMIVPLIEKCIKKSLMAPSLYEQWYMDTVQNVYHWSLIMNEQSKLVSLFEQYKIPFVIMKGAAAGIYYPAPELRTMGDIDILVNPDVFILATKALEESGYKLKDKADHHWEYKKNKTSIELHRYPAGMPKDDAVLMKHFCEGITKREIHTIRSYQFPMLPTVQNGMVLLLHIMYHLEGGLGLRQIIDWTMFANQCMDDDFYKKEFLPILREAKLEVFAETITQMCQMYLGLRDTITWCNGADTENCQYLMSLIMQAGNFGRKEEKTEHSQRLIANRMKYHLRHPLHYFMTLQRDGKERWGLLEKYPWLTPFAWIYRLGYSCRHLIWVAKTGNIGKRMSEADKKQKLFRDLQIEDRYFD